MSQPANNNINLVIGNNFVFKNIQLVKESIQIFKSKDVCITTNLQLDEKTNCRVLQVSSTTIIRNTCTKPMIIKILK